MRNSTPDSALGRALLVCLAASAMLLRPAAAAEPTRAVPSLRLVPADAETYFAMLRNAEQIKAIGASKAWVKFTEMESVQFLWKQVQKGLKDKDNPLVAFFSAAENRPLLDLLADMGSQEIFGYTPAGSGAFIGLLQELQGARYYYLLAQLVSGQRKPEKITRVLLETLNENKDKLKVPGFVIGFRLEDTRRAAGQLERLEKLLNALAEQAPVLKGRFKRSRIGTGSFLTLALDGGMIPWEDVGLKQIEEKPGEFDALVKKLKQLKLTVALGLRGDYLLLSLAESTAPLAALGGSKCLADIDELKPLAKHAGERLTSISYSSKKFNARLQERADIDATLANVQGLLGGLDLTQEQKAKIKKDLTELAKDIKARLPEPGAALGFSFLSKRGIESYAYDWARSPVAPAPARLTLLEHLGGNPLIASVGRSSSVIDYKLLAKWVRKGDSYIDELLLPSLDGGNKQVVERVLKALRPAASRFDEVTTKMLLPSFAAGGESAFVLDGKMTSKKWIPLMPNSARPLALPEPAFVCALRNAALLEKGLGEYRQLFNKLIQDLGTAFDQKIDFEIPAAKTRKLQTGTLYYYQLPTELGFDERLSPNAGIGDKVAAFSLSVAMTERLLARTPFKAGGLLARADRPMMSATYVNWEGLMKAIGPWIEYGLEAAMNVGGNLQPAQQESILKQVRTAVEILSVVRRSTSYTTREGTATVTHSETVIRDLDK
jgi:hypothetical protein